MGLDMYLESHQKETYDLYNEAIRYRTIQMAVMIKRKGEYVYGNCGYYY